MKRLPRAEFKARMRGVPGGCSVAAVMGIAESQHGRRPEVKQTFVNKNGVKISLCASATVDESEDFNRRVIRNARGA